MMPSFIGRYHPIKEEVLEPKPQRRDEYPYAEHNRLDDLNRPIRLEWLSKTFG
jgi:hypothetical protein